MRLGVFVGIRIFRIGGISGFRFARIARLGVFVRIRIFRIGGIFRISFRRIALFAVIVNSDDTNGG